MIKALKRSLGWYLLLEFNRLLGRSWAPSPRRELSIEPTTLCNLGCRFCAYELNLRPRTSMKAELFADSVAQVAALGFSRVWLTPQTGDIFMDKGLEDKLAQLEAVAGIAEVAFYTNLVAADPVRLDRLPGFAKLAEIQISLYGADEAGFVATTRRPASQFHRLLANLDHLAVLLSAWRRPPRLGMALRVGEGFSLAGWSGPLAERALALRDRFGVGLSVDTEYDDWGGAIAQAEVADLGIRLRSGRAIYRRGACIKALGHALISADGSVGACACRDPTGVLRLGDATTQPLAEILSLSNPRYAALLDGMERGEFPEPCHKCSVYRSVYDPRWVGEDKAGTLAEALQRLDPRANRHSSG